MNIKSRHHPLAFNEARGQGRTGVNRLKSLPDRRIIASNVGENILYYAWLSAFERIMYGAPESGQVVRSRPRRNSTIGPVPVGREETLRFIN